MRAPGANIEAQETSKNEQAKPANLLANNRTAADSGLPVVEVDLPRVADSRLQTASKKAVRVANNTILSFATRGTVKPRKQKAKSATRGKSGPVVESGKGSKGTWQFRLRWNSLPGRPVEYVATVTDAVYDLIRKGDYEAYKESIIASYEARTIRASKSA